MPLSKTLEQLRFDNSYARLPEDFFSRILPSPQGMPYLVSFNPAAAALIDLDPGEAKREDFSAIFAGYQLLPGSEPIATVYAGHQFGVYVPRLGDGRAILLGEIGNDAGGHWELQLKGSGPTPYARGFDGRAVLRSTIREYLGSEAMHGLGIATTRALCITGSDAPVYRQCVETSATLVRLAPSHVRFGSFEYFSHSGRHRQLRQLADYVIGHHFAELIEPETAERYALLFAEVVVRTARLMAQWQAVGFAHGVMNTDNMSIIGLTLDYGPYGFLDTYHPGFVSNHSDHQGRYAFNRQPDIALWNLGCLAQALLPLVNQQALKGALEGYGHVYASHYTALMLAKLGLRESCPENVVLVRDLLGFMARWGMDYTNTFRALGRFGANGDNSLLCGRCRDPLAFAAWARRYANRLAVENSNDVERRAGMDRVNPKYVLRNYLAQTAIDKATRDKDFSEIDRLLELLQDPYAERPDRDSYAAEPPQWGRHIEVSCSS